jgi:nicotinate-nucleotide adenylyltransferase
MGDTGARLTGIFGGTFDPIHYGHLRVAEEISEIADLAEMRFVPAALPRLRPPPVAEVHHRVEMVRLAIDGNSRFILDLRETRRHGTSYSIDTLREMKQQLGDEAILCFMLGADAFIKLAQWQSWRELFRLCHFIVAARPGHPLLEAPESLPRELKLECQYRWVSRADDLAHARSGLVFLAPTSLLEISATNIRTCISSRKSARYLLPDATLDYISMNQLYLESQ